MLDPGVGEELPERAAEAAVAQDAQALIHHGRYFTVNCASAARAQSTGVRSLTA
jgi:hypothetical protein